MLNLNPLLDFKNFEMNNATEKVINFQS